MSPAPDVGHAVRRLLRVAPRAPVPDAAAAALFLCKRLLPVRVFGSASKEATKSTYGTYLMQFLPRFVPCAKNIDVDAKEEEEAAQE